MLINSPYSTCWGNYTISTTSLLFVIGIHSIQGWAGSSRHRLTEKVKNEEPKYGRWLLNLDLKAFNS